MNTELEQWEHTKALIGDDRTELGPYFSYQLKNTPRRILFSLSYHKFAAKLIGGKKRILEVGCGEALASMVLAEFAQKYVGIDIDKDAIEVAKKSFAGPNKSFIAGDVLTATDPLLQAGAFDAVASFDVIEHIFPENADHFLATMTDRLHADGVMIVGTPNLTSAQYASKVTNAGHVNLYSADRLQESLQKYFRTVFIFSANDEVVHTGFYPMAHYLIGVGIGRNS